MKIKEHKKQNTSEKINQTITDYNKQKCKCGHTLIFLPQTEYLYCNYCGRKVTNKTKGHFFSAIYKKIYEKK